MTTNRLAPAIATIALASLVVLSASIVAGPLDPPDGPVAPTHKTLTEVEPRIAINATNTPGDSDSLYKITQPGSYYLTGNIIGVLGKHGIEIASKNVTLDLNGFDLAGVPGMGAFDGISVQLFFLNSIAVLNGTVREWGDDGVDLGFLSFGCRVERVRALSNAGLGILAGQRAAVGDCAALFNLGEGIRTVEGSIISRCVSNSNGGPGFQVDQSCTISECSATLNTGPGILAATGCSVLDTTCHENASDGIQIGDGGTVSRCNVFNNIQIGVKAGDRCTISECTATSNGARGIEAGSGVSVLGCSASSNVGSGFFVNVNSTVSECNANGNGGVGIDGSSACTIIQCNAAQNGFDGIDSGLGSTISGCTTRSNGSNGIRASGGLVVGNSCHGNDDAGILVAFGETRIEDNNCVDNSKGIDVDASGNIIVRNTCAGNGTNWTVVAGNVCFVVNAVTAGSINGNSGGTPPGSTDPNANFAY